MYIYGYYNGSADKKYLGLRVCESCHCLTEQYASYTYTRPHFCFIPIMNIHTGHYVRCNACNNAQKIKYKEWRKIKGEAKGMPKRQKYVAAHAKLKSIAETCDISELNVDSLYAKLMSGLDMEDKNGHLRRMVELFTACSATVAGRTAAAAAAAVPAAEIAAPAVAAAAPAAEIAAPAAAAAVPAAEIAAPAAAAAVPAAEIAAPAAVAAAPAAEIAAPAASTDAPVAAAPAAASITAAPAAVVPVAAPAPAARSMYYVPDGNTQSAPPVAAPTAAAPVTFINPAAQNVQAFPFAVAPSYVTGYESAEDKRKRKLRKLWLIPAILMVPVALFMIAVFVTLISDMVNGKDAFDLLEAIFEFILCAVPTGLDVLFFWLALREN